MMLIGFGVKILFLIHNRSYVNVMYKDFGDFLRRYKKKVSVRMKVSDPCDPLVLLSFTPPLLTIRNMMI